MAAHLENFLEGNIKMDAATKKIKNVLSIYWRKQFNYFKIAMSYKQKSSNPMAV